MPPEDEEERRDADDVSLHCISGQFGDLRLDDDLAGADDKNFELGPTPFRGDSEETTDPSRLAVVVGAVGDKRYVQLLNDNVRSPNHYYLLDHRSVCTNADVPKGSLPDVHVYITIEELEELVPKKTWDKQRGCWITDKKKKEKGKDLEDEKTSTSVYIVVSRILEYSLDEHAVDYYEMHNKFPTRSLEWREENNEFNKEEQPTEAVVIVTEEKNADKQSHDGWTKYKNVILVAGSPFDRPFPALCPTDGIKKHVYVRCEYVTTDPFFEPTPAFGTLCYTFSYILEAAYKRKLRQIKAEQKDVQAMLERLYANYEGAGFSSENSPLFDCYRNKTQAEPTTGYPIPKNIRKLTSAEENTILMRCRNTENRDDARLFIRDVEVAHCRLTAYQAAKKSRNFSIMKPIQISKSNGQDKYSMRLILNAVEKKRLIESTEDSAWKLGSVLKMIHGYFHRHARSAKGVVFKNFAYVKIDKIEAFKENKTRVLLVPHGDSIDIFNILSDKQKWTEKFQDFSGTAVRIGPEDEDATMFDFTMAISRKFDNFLENWDLFDAYRGVQHGSRKRSSFPSASSDGGNDSSSTDEYSGGDFPSLRTEYFEGAAERLTEFMERNTDAPVLNKHQHDMLHAILTTLTSFNVGQAPPGTGKTHLISHGIKLIRNHWPVERILLSAPTNQAINNVVEKLHHLEDDFPICREMSKQGEETVSETIHKYMLSRRCLKDLPADQFRGGHEPEVLLQALFDYKRASEACKNKKIPTDERLNLFEVKHNAFSMLKKTWLECALPFISASSPAILCRHADQYTSVRLPIRTLFLDEASQLPSYIFLALLCSFPRLEKIILIGDSKQLGPHCLHQKSSGLLYDVTKKSELDRIAALPDTPQKRLVINFRSHPYLVNKIISQVYGPGELSAGLPAEKRALAARYKLPYIDNPLARPVSFIDIEHSKEHCNNPNERAQVMQLLKEIITIMSKSTKKKFSLKPDDLVVIVFHKKQRQLLEDALRKVHIPTIALKEELMKVPIVTVDSYQGREAKIVILCTTKTSTSHNPDIVRRQLSFVSDERRCNVAVSRAQEVLYVLGDCDSLSLTDFWRGLAGPIKQDRHKPILSQLKTPPPRTLKG